MSHNLLEMENEVSRNVVDGYYNISEYHWIYRADSTSKLLFELQEKGKIKGIKVCLDIKGPECREYKYYRFLDKNYSAAICRDDRPSQRVSKIDSTNRYVFVTSWILLGRTFAFTEGK